MGSCRKAGGAPVRPAVDACGRWLRLDARIGRLMGRWARLESRLAKEQGWLGLSAAERAASPAGEGLRALDARLELLLAAREALLAALPTQGTGGLEAVAVRLAVVERLVPACEHPKAHALIEGARRDLEAMAGRRG